jgi:SAM-dependent methyltransferase
MGSHEEYAEFVGRRSAILPDFDSRQERAAQNIYDLLAPFVRNGEIDTIVDLGCGTGEILVSLRDKFSKDLAALSFGGLSLVGLDFSASEVDQAKSNVIKAGTAEGPVTIEFVHCDGSDIFLDDLAASLGHRFSSRVKSRMAVLCTGHTIFHFSYLPELFRRMQSAPERPKLWLVDVYRSWDHALEVCKTREFLEPRSVQSSGDKRIINVLFTRRSKTSPAMVERGLYELAGDGGCDRTVVTTLQHDWSVEELKNRFSSVGYILDREIDTECGYGEMKTLLYRLPSRSVPISKWFLAGDDRAASGVTKPGDNSPVPAVREWIFQTGMISDSGFDFILVEFAPYFDAWQGRENLRQEIFLGARREFSSTKFETIIEDYDRR